jgi:hypothetical protein
VIRIGLPGEGRPGTTLALRSLRRHLAVFAGSGSGKTVLLRRVIEECALQGVSSIVLDPNNDLARLGDPWPAAPGQWLGEDAGRAARYLAETDVVVWTPRRAGGRPLTFQPLPDFGAVIDEVDEFEAAVDSAVEALAPRIIARQGSRSAQEKAVLTEAMRYFGRGAAVTWVRSSTCSRVCPGTSPTRRGRRRSPPTSLTGCAPFARPTRCSAGRPRRPTLACSSPRRPASAPASA